MEDWTARRPFESPHVGLDEPPFLFLATAKDTLHDAWTATYEEERTLPNGERWRRTWRAERSTSRTRRAGRMDVRPSDVVTSTARALAQGLAHLLRLWGRPFDKYPSEFQDPAAAPGSREGI